MSLFANLQRKIGQRLDQIFSVIQKKIFPVAKIPDFDGDCRFALLTVNFSTTHFLKLMLLTLCQQNNRQKITRIVIVDNDSKDGGLDFLRNLSKSIFRIELVENRWIRTHARGLRKGIYYLNKLESSLEKQLQSNVLMICDTDIIFRNPNTITELAEIFNSKKYAFAGELRYSSNICPQAQASFLCLRRDVYKRKEISPIVNHGSPAYPMQKSLWENKYQLYDFRSNSGGYILHRGRSGVAAAGKHYSTSSYSSEKNNKPHFMAVENGEQIWKDAENQFAELLLPENESELIKYLKNKLS